MSFKRFLLESEEFEKAHQEFKALKPPVRGFWSYAQKPTPEQEAYEKRRQELKRVRQGAILIASLDNYTSGWHGRDGEDDIPADDPIRGAEWEINLKTRDDEQKLLGRKVLMTNNSGGSYHESWVHVKLYVMVDDDVLESLSEELQKEYVSLDSTEKISQFFPFTGLSQAITYAYKVLDYEEGDNPVKPGETAEDYWARLMRAANVNKQNPNDNYKSSDDYFKR